MNTTTKQTTMSTAFAHDVLKRGKVLTSMQAEVSNLVDQKGNEIKEISIHIVRYKSKTYKMVTTLPNEKGASFAITNLCS